MCGIAGVVNCSDAEHHLYVMLKNLYHRGDFSDPVAVINSHVAFGMRRLRINDWNNAVQPYWSFDERWLLIYNGEIYNYRELRQMLEKRNIKFKTDSDTEVLINGIAEIGVDFISQLNGMFAFVAYCPDTNEFIAARDPMGIKPLYFQYYEEGLCFASEIKPILNSFPEGQVHALQPGFIFTKNGIKPYSLNSSGLMLKNLGDNANHLHKILEDSVRIRIPDFLDTAVKFGGGIDSTLILHYARKYKPDIKAYFIGNKKGKDYQYALEYADSTNLNLQIVNYDENRVFELIEMIVQTTETFEPTIIRNSIFSYLLAEQIHNDGIRVALCGEGADELFWGYPEMKISKDIPKTGANFLKDLHRSHLQRVDRCSMKKLVETRIPFFDPRILNFANELPPEQKIGYYESRLAEKIILRELYKLIPELPNNIRLREKVVLVDGAGMSDNDQFSGPFFEFAEDNISNYEFRQGMRKYSSFSPETKEDIFYLQFLEKKMDINRVPSLKQRPNINRKMKL